MSLDDKLDRVVARHEQLSDMLASTDGSDPQEFVKLLKQRVLKTLLNPRSKKTLTPNSTPIRKGVSKK